MRLSLVRQNKNLPWMGITKTAIALLPILLLVSLLNDHLFFSKLLHYTYRPGHRGHAVVPRTPSQVVKSGDPDLRWRVTSDNVLFNVTLPRLIDAVRVRVRLNEGTQPYLALKATEKKGGEITTIIHAAALDGLNWKNVTDGDVTLWMRDQQGSVLGTTQSPKSVKQYDSIDAFRVSPPDLRSVGVVGVEPMAFAKVENYAPSIAPLKIGHTLRGSHQLYVYAANETLQLTFDKIDLNRSKGTDGVTVRVARVDGLKIRERVWMKTVTVGDDGISSNQGPRGRVQPVSMEIPNVQSGVYLIDISTSEDILLANMTTRQHVGAFDERVFIAEGPAYAEKTYSPVVLHTNGSRVTTSVIHEQAKQDANIGGKKVGLQDVKVDHETKITEKEAILNYPKGDIIVSSDGLLAFDGMKLIPNGARFVDVTTLNQDFSSFDYVLADYQPNTTSTLVVDQTYLVNDLSLSGKTLTFNVFAPGLEATGSTYGLKDIRVTMVRGVFPWDKIWKKLGIHQ